MAHWKAGRYNEVSEAILVLLGYGAERVSVDEDERADSDVEFDGSSENTPDDVHQYRSVAHVGAAGADVDVAHIHAQLPSKDDDHSSAQWVHREYQPPFPSRSLPFHQRCAIQSDQSLY